MTTVFKEFRFEAAHRLTKVPEGHKCARLHGHSYLVRVEVAGRVNECGMVVDYADVSHAWKPLHNLFDHHYLNEQVGFETTSENLAKFIHNELKGDPQLGDYHLRVTVRETCTAGAVYP